jgi:hypothetical protein
MLGGHPLSHEPSAYLATRTHTRCLLGIVCCEESIRSNGAGSVCCEESIRSNGAGSVDHCADISDISDCCFGRNGGSLKIK